LSAHVAKRAVAVVAVQRVRLGCEGARRTVADRTGQGVAGRRGIAPGVDGVSQIVDNIEIQIAVAVEVGESAARGPAGTGQTGFPGFVLERPIAFVAVERSLAKAADV